MNIHFIWCDSMIILGPFLFNLFLSDPFLFLYDISESNYADDTPYCTGLEISNVLIKSENTA